MGIRYQRRRLTMTKEAYYKIGILILALSAITWMFMSNSWGAELKEKGNCSNCHGFTRLERGLR
jgi:hypothetical protein